MKNDPRAHINIGAIIFPNMDQCDFTGPFEVLCRLPDSNFHVVWKRKEPIRDCHGLILTPGSDLAECPKLDLLVVPGDMGKRPLWMMKKFSHSSAHNRVAPNTCSLFAPVL